MNLLCKQLTCLGIIFLLIVSPNALKAQDDFKELWNEVTRLESLSRPSGAMLIADSIFSLAERNENIPHKLKAIIYKIKLSSMFEEGTYLKYATLLDTLSQRAEGAEKALYLSVLAEVRWRYMRENFYQISQRTALMEPGQDMEWWDTRTFAREIRRKYLESLLSSDLTFKIPVRDFAAVLETAEGSEILRPTLYDLLAHRAIEFLTSNDASYDNLGESRDFSMDEGLLYDARSFTAREMDPSAGAIHATLSIYQDLLRKHAGDKENYALIDLELERLEYIHQNLPVPFKDSLYTKALQTLFHQYSNSPVSVDITYRLAMDIWERSQPNQAKSDAFDAGALTTAVQMLDTAISKYPEAFHTPHCKQLRQEIWNKDLEISLNDVILPGEEFLGLVSYRNLDKINIAIFPETFTVYRQELMRSEVKAPFVKYLSRNPLVKQSFSLPASDDHYRHSIELPFSSLKKGFYVMLAMDAATNPADSLPHSVIRSFWISDIAWVSSREEEGDLNIYVSSRETGKPLGQAVVSVFFRTYDYRTRSFNESAGPVVQTDADGIARISVEGRTGGNNQAYLTIRYKDDFVVTEDQFRFWNRGSHKTETQTLAAIFTDRSIYRPGQTVYFKGILYTANASDYKVKPGGDVPLSLMDANGQKVAEVSLRSDEYGSFNATFSLPSTGLSGNYRIQSPYGGTNLQVEEYKRPRFEVLFDPTEGEYGLNDTLRVSGKARGYAGNTIGNARVKYRVVRSAWYPYYPWWEFRIFPQIQTGEEITSGETMTEADGSFELSFMSLPGTNTYRAYEPVYNYEVKVEVTDLTGEVREGNTMLKAGKTSLLIETNIPARIDKNAGHSYSLYTRNLMGKRLDAEVLLEIIPLTKPERVLRERSWETPDQFFLEEAEFAQRFPLDPYADAKKLQQSEVLRQYTYNTSTDSLINLNTLTYFAEGQYLLRFTTLDKSGKKVMREDKIELYASLEGKDPFGQQLWAQLSKAEAAPGETLNLLLSSGAEQITVMLEIYNPQGLRERKWINIEKEKKIIPILVSAEDEGGISVKCLTIHANRVIEKDFSIQVQRRGISMDMKIERFRSRIEPGSKEEWSIHFLGDDGKKVMPELVLSMYDASLDAILPHKWFLNLSYPGVRSLYWEQDGGFGLANGRNYEPSQHYFQIPQRGYDALNWMGLNFWYVGRGDMMFSAMDEGVALPRANRKSAAGDIIEMDKVPGEEVEQEISHTPSSSSQPVSDFIRRDLAETAFFFPHLRTNEEGEIIVSFSAPEALTRWNILGLAHTRDMRLKSFTKELITARDLMIIPNLPRHLYQGDEIILKCRVANTGEKDLSGQASISIRDAISGEDMKSLLSVEALKEEFTITPDGGAEVSWSVIIPENCPGLLQVTFKAVSGNIADGEEHYLPVLTSKTLVTETHQIFLKAQESKRFQFEALAKGLASGKRSHQLSFEYTANPAWYVVQALPYLMEGDNQSSYAVFNRFFANSLASYIIQSNKEIENVFKIWSDYQPEALWSALEKNQDLKSVLLNETPWVRDAKNEKESRQRLSNYFQEDIIRDKLAREWQDLLKLQSPEGGWSWYPGMRLNQHITTEILAGLGFLLETEAIAAKQEEINAAVKGSRWLLAEMIRDKKEMERLGRKYVDEYRPGSARIYELYATRIWMEEFESTSEERGVWQYFFDRATACWTDYSIQVQSILGTTALREGKVDLSDKIIRSLRDKALTDKDGAIYWRDLGNSHRWDYSAEGTMARVIEFFHTAGAEQTELDAMRTWLLRRKQVTHWNGSKATAMACQAFLMRGSNWLNANAKVDVIVGKEVLPGSGEALKTEAGSGYFRKTWKAEDILPEMANMSVSSSSQAPSWGAAYYQYFAEMSEVLPQAEGFALRKTIAIVGSDGEGEVLNPVSADQSLKVGERVRVRIEIESERDLDYVHLKDLRAALFEPTDKTSGYRYGGGLSWYLSVKDVSTEFFFERLAKGIWVVEYDMFVSQEGSFSSGPASIQCLYAPEYAAHSGGMEVRSEK